MRHVRITSPQGQTWATFLRNHAKEVWACDFLQVTDLFFRSLLAFFIIELKSRRVIHVGVTQYPTDTWTAQQLREATPFGQTPKYLRSISFEIMIASLAPVSLVLQQRAASRSSKRRIVPRERMRSVNAFWAVCDESALTTCWSSMRSSCIVSYVPTLSISMRHDHIKASTSRFRKGKSPLFHEISVVIESFRFRSWVGYTMRTEERPERYNVTVAIPEGGAFRVPPRCSLSCLKETFSLRPLVTGKPGYSVQN